MKKLCIFILSISLFVISNFSCAENLLVIKYRPDPVDVDKPYFEYLDTSTSSFIEGAWYDASNKYMIINLKGVNYHYCGLDKATWNTYKQSSSFGKSYHALIKGRFDCRENPVPIYK